MLKFRVHAKKPDIPLLLIALAALWVAAPPCLADPVAVETKALSSPVADPFVSYVAVGPRHEFEPVYRVLGPGACAVLAHRVLIQRYANYENMVIEELGFAGSRCHDIRVRKSYSINGVTLGYALGEGTRFAWNIEFVRWESWDTFVIRSAKKDFRVRIGDDGKVFAEPEKGQGAR